MKLNRLFRTRSSRLVLIILGLALVHGLVYIFLVPPWQHYDEPNHFEYAWLMSERGTRPQPGDYDQSMRREVAASMMAHGFFRDLNFLPDLNNENEPIWIGGFSQLSNSPLYYALVAVPLRILPIESVTHQLYIGRIVSLLLFLLSVLAAWGIAVVLTPPCHPLRLLVPLTVALVPGYVDLMTSVNNDVGAIAFFSLVLWGSVTILRRGPALGPVLLTLLAVVLGFFTKETAYFSLPVFLLALIFSLFTGRKRWAAWAVFVAGLAALLGSVFTWGDAALWYRSTGQVANTRVASDLAVVGDHALQLDSGAMITPSWLVPVFQPIPGATGKGLGGETYTLGTWMWASVPVAAHLPIFNDGKQAFTAEVLLGTQPEFFTLSATLSPESVHRVWVSLSPQPVSSDPDIRIFYDGLVLAKGERPADHPPEFDAPDGSSGVWGGETFQNLIRNGSAETGGLRLRAWADDWGAKIFPDNTRPSLLVTYLLDWKGAFPYYRATADRLFRTFWGLFGWAHVPLLGGRPYRFLLVATLVGVAGSLPVLWQKRRAIPWDLLVLFGLTLAAIWGLTFVRGASYLGHPNLYIPVARYAFPAMIPSVLLLSAGWFFIWKSFALRLRLPGWGMWVLYLIPLVVLDLLALVSIFRFYQN